MQDRECAPIIIPTLCRYEHLRRCIESLQKNKLSIKTELFIGIDYPAREEHWDGYSKIKEYLEKGVEGFLNVTLIFHDENKGEDRNVTIIKEKVYEKYDRYIFTEDDNEFSPNFLEFMNKYLIEYENDSNVQAITGYAYPVEYPIEDRVYLQNVYFAAYGYGTWRKKEEEMFADLTAEYFKRILCDQDFMKKLRKKSTNQYCNFIKGMLGYGTDLLSCEKIRKIDISYGIWMFHKDRNMMFSTTSMVRNWGFDGTGLNCEVLCNEKRSLVNHRTYNYSQQTIDNKAEYMYNGLLNMEQTAVVDCLLDDFFKIERKEYIRTVVALQLIRIFGLKNMRKWISKLKRG